MQNRQLDLFRTFLILVFARGTCHEPVHSADEKHNLMAGLSDLEFHLLPVFFSGLSFPDPAQRLATFLYRDVAAF